MYTGSSYGWSSPFRSHSQQLLTVRVDGTKAIEAVICGARVGEVVSEEFRSKG